MTTTTHKPNNLFATPESMEALNEWIERHAPAERAHLYILQAMYYNLIVSKYDLKLKPEAKPMSPLTAPANPKAGDVRSWIDTVWEALHAYHEDNPTHFEENPEAWDDICTAMAWIQEALSCSEQVDEPEEKGE